jgi:hypothetical protein
VTVTRLSGLAVSCAGAGFVATGWWGRREVRRTLERERIVSDGKAVTSGAAARSLAEQIRESTLAAAGGRTYSEVADGESEQRLWLQSTTLQTALIQAYTSAKLAELLLGLGAVFVAAGAGIAAAARPARRTGRAALST